MDANNKPLTEIQITEGQMEKRPLSAPPTVSTVEFYDSNLPNGSKGDYSYATAVTGTSSTDFSNNDSMQDDGALCLDQEENATQADKMLTQDADVDNGIMRRPVFRKNQNPDRRVKYWYSRAGDNNTPYMNIRRKAMNGKNLSANFEMCRIPEVICNSVFYYLVCKQNPVELYRVLNICMESVKGSVRTREDLNNINSDSVEFNQ